MSHTESNPKAAVQTEVTPTATQNNATENLSQSDDSHSEINTARIEKIFEEIFKEISPADFNINLKPEIIERLINFFSEAITKEEIFIPAEKNRIPKLKILIENFCKEWSDKEYNEDTIKKAIEDCLKPWLSEIDNETESVQQNIKDQDGVIYAIENNQKVSIGKLHTNNDMSLLMKSHINANNLITLFNPCEINTFNDQLNVYLKKIKNHGRSNTSLILTPFNINKHWVLIATEINMDKTEDNIVKNQTLKIYYIDSLFKKDKKFSQTKANIKNALKTNHNDITIEAIEHFCTGKQKDGYTCGNFVVDYAKKIAGYYENHRQETNSIANAIHEIRNSTDKIDADEIRRQQIETALKEKNKSNLTLIIRNGQLTTNLENNDQHSLMPLQDENSILDAILAFFKNIWTKIINAFWWATGIFRRKDTQRNKAILAEDSLTNTIVSSSSLANISLISGTNPLVDQQQAQAAFDDNGFKEEQAAENSPAPKHDEKIQSIPHNEIIIKNTSNGNLNNGLMAAKFIRATLPVQTSNNKKISSIIDVSEVQIKPGHEIKCQGLSRETIIFDGNTLSSKVGKIDQELENNYYERTYKTAFDMVIHAYIQGWDEISLSGGESIVAAAYYFATIKLGITPDKVQLIDKNFNLNDKASLVKFENFINKGKDEFYSNPKLIDTCKLLHEEYKQALLPLPTSPKP